MVIDHISNQTERQTKCDLDRSRHLIWIEKEIKGDLNHNEFWFYICQKIELITNIFIDRFESHFLLLSYIPINWSSSLKKCFSSEEMRGLITKNPSSVPIGKCVVNWLGTKQSNKRFWRTVYDNIFIRTSNGELLWYHQMPRSRYKILVVFCQTW